MTQTVASNSCDPRIQRWTTTQDHDSSLLICNSM